VVALSFSLVGSCNKASLTLIQTAKLNDVDPQAWLADVLARIADHKINDLAALLPWNWRLAQIDRAA
jgi:transposase